MGNQLIIHDLLPGRHSTMAAFLNKDTESNSQESKTDKSTFWKFVSDISATVHQINLICRSVFVMAYILVFFFKFNSYLAIIIVKKQKRKFLSPEKKLLEIVWDV